MSPTSSNCFPPNGSRMLREYTRSTLSMKSMRSALTMLSFHHYHEFCTSRRISVARVYPKFHDALFGAVIEYLSVGIEQIRRVVVQFPDCSGFLCCSLLCLWSMKKVGIIVNDRQCKRRPFGWQKAVFHAAFCGILHCKRPCFCKLIRLVMICPYYKSSNLITSSCGLSAFFFCSFSPSCRCGLVGSMFTEFPITIFSSAFIGWPAFSAAMESAMAVLSTRLVSFFCRVVAVTQIHVARDVVVDRLVEPPVVFPEVGVRH